MKTAIETINQQNKTATKTAIKAPTQANDHAYKTTIKKKHPSQTPSNTIKPTPSATIAIIIIILVVVGPRRALWCFVARCLSSVPRLRRPEAAKVEPSEARPGRRDLSKIRRHTTGNHNEHMCTIVQLVRKKK